MRIDGVACDYCFMGEGVESKILPILVHKFYRDRWVTAHVVKRKGPDEHAVDTVADDLEAAGVTHF
eukprot:4362905-Amphidinium_carterae.1